MRNLRRISFAIVAVIALVGVVQSQRVRSDPWGPSAVPSGSVMSYAGKSAPTGWFMAYGQAVSRTQYAALFAAVGTTYGIGDGSTTFNLPDMRGRLVAGVDNMGGSAASRITSTDGITGTTLGSAGGHESAALTAGMIAQVSTSYTPAGTNVLSSITGLTPSSTTTTTESATHIHRVDWRNFSVTSGGSAIRSAIEALNTQTAGDMGTESATHTHNVPQMAVTGTAAAQTFNGTGATITVGSASPTAVPKLAPTMMLNYIIKA